MKQVLFISLLLIFSISGFHASAENARQAHENDSIFLTTDILASVDNIAHLQQMWARSLANVQAPNTMVAKADTAKKLQLELISAKDDFHRGQYELALKKAIKIEHSEYAGPWLAFKACMFLRNAYFYLGAFDKSLHYHEKLQAPEMEAYAGQIWPSSQKAITDIHVGEYPQAAATIESSLAFAVASTNSSWEVSLQNALGHVLLKMRQIDRAILAFESARKKAESLQSAGLLSEKATLIIDGNIAKAYQAQGNFQDAIPLLERTLETLEAKHAGSWSLHHHLEMLIGLCRSNIKINQTEAAANYLEQAWKLMDFFDMGWHQSDYFRCRWKLHERKGASKLALQAAEQFYQVLDSTKGAENNLISKSLKIAYETTQYEEIQQEQEQQLLKMREKSQREKFIRNTGFFITIILFLVVLLVYRAYSEKLKSERRLNEKSVKVEEQRQIISRSLEEKDTLLREIHHRVKNNLQIISSLFFLQADKMQDEKAKAVIREAQSRVNVMSLIHQKLYQSQNLNMIDFQSYIQDLSRQIIQTHQRADLQIDMVIEANGIKQPLDKAVAIGMIINELLTNSIKHAFVGRKIGHITIHLKENGDLIRLQYSDDGQGISTLDNMEKADSLGMKLIRLLTNQMNGALEFDATDGFKVDIEFDMS